MFGSHILEIAIGLVFVYLFLSVVCSAVSELIARALKWRARDLERGIRNLLADPLKADEFFRHPLVKGLGEKPEEGKKFNRVRGLMGGPAGKPSYIRSRTFALALLDTVAPADPGADSKVFKDVRDGVAKLTNSEMRRALLALVDEASGDLKKALENVENWFNEAMDRVSGWYKRKAQLTVLLLALAVTVALNVDTVMIVNGLSQDSVLRAAVVARAEEIAKKPLTAGPDTSLTLAEELDAQVQQLQLPIGWSSKHGDPRGLPVDSFAWAGKIVGLLLTTMAVSLGAPFWFDVLNRFTNLRGTGKQPAVQKQQKLILE